MTIGSAFLWHQAKRRLQRFSLGLRGDERGTAAIEFAMVGMPFMMMMFGMVAVGLHFYKTFTIENAIEQAARPIRTGEAQTAGLTKAQFKANFCAYAMLTSECDGQVRINVQNYALTDVITPPACTDAGGALVPPASEAFAMGAANRIVLVTICYDFTLAGLIPFLQPGTMGGGSTLIQASTTFKIEPYS